MNNPNENPFPCDEAQPGAAVAAPRYKINLHSSVIITASSTDGEKPDIFLQGQLLDVSRSGIGLYISVQDKKQLDSLGADLSMHLLLPLPVKAIEIVVTPVRFEQLQGEANEDKILLGTHITNMNSRERILFMQFINDFEDLQN